MGAGVRPGVRIGSSDQAVWRLAEEHRIGEERGDGEWRQA